MPAAAASGAPERLYNNAKLVAWREAAGLTREQVCVETSISYASLSQLERGTDRYQPRLGTIATLARFYGHAPAELLDVEESPEPAPTGLTA